MTAPCFRNTRFFTLTGILICALLSTAALAQKSQFTLPPGCTLPFDNIATKPDPFQQCGNCGVVSNKAQGTEVQAKALQSQAKNDFCADYFQGRGH